MKNYLKYYYNIDVDSIHQRNSDYYFEKDGYNYIFLQYKGDLTYLEEIFDFSNQILYNGIYCNQILKNNNQSCFTNIDNKNYVLIKYRQNLDRKIDSNDVLSFSNISISNEKIKCGNWKNLWEVKINYFEHQLNHFGEKHPLLKNSFGYYAGYVELAIALLNNINNEKEKQSLSHKRINKDYTLYDLYNPFNFIIDTRIRDISEYLKGKMFEKNVFDETKKILQKLNLDQSEYYLFFIRMLFPTFYFDKFEEIITDNLSDENIKSILDNSLKYEEYIKQLYNYLNLFGILPNIEWLRK